ncbi:MAG TPA: cysteine desulfurase NifS [Acidobacteriota bacterium]|mgnify:FL=1|nr:cysteine desulfurase NifS [Acidobacteriota bacterium]HOT00280.1 cysteine desulfurase NifS [Acidobacteriota bacterium]HQF86571.1 cysteine desulfurase NifS [Acidobacteriota bacterium]HQG90177.1 cysteine desulfurase NifS [Acidobacteriota bacterium]HQK88358.1 cysteine desulfurase NifS [Acidobacteriota bacterium]
MNRVVYLDNNATTRVADEVVEAMLPFFSELYGNPSSMHAFGGQVARHVARAREQVAAILGADPTEILFVSCGSESDNMAVRGVLEASPDKRHVVSTRVEHPAVLSLCNHLRKRGYEVTLLGVDGEGRLDLTELRNALRPDTAVVSVMYANNETGVVFPVEEVGQIVKAHGAAFHVDAVQAVGKIPLDMSRSTIDLLSLSGHKLHAPKGVGVLYIRKGVRLVPLIIGGHQERNRRGGTENVASIVGLGRACELAQAALGEENERVCHLRDKLENGILCSIPNVRVNGNREHRLPNTTSISFEYIEGEAILLLLDQLGICASSGSACTSGSLEPSHVLRAMGVPFTAAHGSIRFSLSRYNTEAEIDYVLEHLPPLIERLRNISPFWKDYREQLARQS